MNESALEKYVKLKREEFWQRIDDKNNDIPNRLGRLFTVKNVPRERHTELLHTVYCVACQKYLEYDESRSAFPTWITMWGQAIVKNYVRNSKGWRSPLHSETTESDLEALFSGSNDKRDPDGFDNIADTRHLNRESADRHMIVRAVLSEYMQNLERCFDDNDLDSDKYLAVFQTLVHHGFDVTDTQIASEVELSHTTVHKYRLQIYAELATMLAGMGLGKHDIGL